MKSGTKGLVVYKGKILLVLRDNKPDIPYPNTWEYIGGAKEDNETFEEAGLREIKEEFGVRPKNYVFLGLDKYPERQAGRFIAILDEGEYQNIKFGNEGQRYGFFSLNETLDMDMAPGIKRFLKDNETVLKGIIECNNAADPKKFVFENKG